MNFFQRVLTIQFVVWFFFFRLASHLGFAFVIYLGLFWTGLSHLLKSTTTTTTTTLHAMRTSAVAMNPLFRIATLGVGILVFLTALSGAFVAGLDAGFNHFFHFLSLTCLFFFWFHLGDVFLVIWLMLCWLMWRSGVQYFSINGWRTYSSRVLGTSAVVEKFLWE